MISVNTCRALGACLFVSSLSATSISPALAEPVSAPPAPRPVAPGSEEALQRYQEGIAARQLGDWEKARTLLLKSWELQHHFQTAANLGEMELKLGQHREAAEHLTYFLREAPASIPDADRARGQAMFDQARASLGTLRVVTPRDAEVYIDGQRVEEVPPNNLVFVEPGRRRVEARLRGYPPISKTLEVPVNSVVVVNLPVSGMKSPERVAVDRKDGPRGWVVVTGIAATALGATMGTGFAILSEVKRHERNDQRDNTLGCRRFECEPYNAPERARGHLLTASLVSFLAAGALGAGTLTYALATRGKAKGEATATVSVGPGGATGVVGFTW